MISLPHKFLGGELGLGVRFDVIRVVFPQAHPVLGVLGVV